MRGIVALLPLLVSSCATAAPSETPITWCIGERSDLAVEEVENAEFWPVRPGRMAASIRTLRQDTVVELSRERAHALGAPRTSATGLYYLVRATVYAPPGARPAQLPEYTRTASYHLWIARGGNAVVIVAQPAISGGLRPQKVAMLLRTEQPINRVLVACYWIP